MESKKQNRLKNLAIQDNTLVQEMRSRVKNKAMLRESKKIAMQILFKLRELQMTQTELAEKLNVSPQFVSKLISGTENLTLETIVKIQKALDIAILVSYKTEKEGSGYTPVLYTAKASVKANEKVTINASESSEYYWA